MKIWKSIYCTEPLSKLAFRLWWTLFIVIWVFYEKKVSQIGDCVEYPWNFHIWSKFFEHNLIIIKFYKFIWALYDITSRIILNLNPAMNTHARRNDQSRCFFLPPLPLIISHLYKFILDLSYYVWLPCSITMIKIILPGPKI